MALVAVGCSSSNGSSVDVSPEGQLSYACALVSDIVEEHHDVESWTMAVGDEADPALHQFVAALSLLGAPIGVREDQGSLSEAATTGFLSFQRFVVDDVQSAVDELDSACEEHELPEGDHDVSTEGQAEYGCALIKDVMSDDGTVESSEVMVGDGADPAVRSTTGALGLFGGMLGAQSRHGELSKGATDGFRALSQANLEDLQRVLDQLDTACRDRSGS